MLHNKPINKILSIIYWILVYYSLLIDKNYNTIENIDVTYKKISC